MKKILITILIFLFTSISNSYAVFFENQLGESNYSSYTSTDDRTNNSMEEEGYFSNKIEPEDTYGGFFKSTSGGNPLDNRPGTGGGIGQGTDPAPIGKGLHTLLVCSLIYAMVKVSSDKKKE